MSHVEEAIRMWETYREGTIGEFTNIPEEQWEHRAGDGARNVRELALHIAVSAIAFTDALLSPEVSFTRLRDPEMRAKLEAPYANASKAEMLELLKSSGADNAKRLREAGETLARQQMPFFNSEQSRLAGLWFAAAHEMYHRGQLTAYERSVGTVPALTQQIHAMQAQAR
jgi:uncharacterized damage-inducible protein DinB